MYLKSLHVKNFKSHQNSKIEFGQITSIIGRSDSGKTNLFRALKLLLHHEDWPAGWIRYGQETASIELELVDGTTITRKRTKTTQSVSISVCGKIEIYEGKKDATEFIQKALGIKKVTLDESTGPEDLNFVEVHDGPYLIGGRADTVQRKIAGIVGANEIDDARSKLLKKTKELEIQSSFLGAEIARLTPEITNRESRFKSTQDSLQKAEKLDKHRKDNESKLQILYNFFDHLENLSLLIPTYSVVQNITKLYQEICTLSREVKKVIFQLGYPTQLRKRLKTLICVVESEKLNSLHKEVLTLKTLLGQTNIQLTSLGQFLELGKIRAYIVRQEQEEKDLREKLDQVLLERKQKLKELIICPVCQQPIK